MMSYTIKRFLCQKDLAQPLDCALQTGTGMRYSKFENHNRVLDSGVANSGYQDPVPEIREHDFLFKKMNA